MKTLISVFSILILTSCFNNKNNELQSTDSQNYENLSELAEKQYQYDKDYKNSIINFTKAIKLHPINPVGKHAEDYLFRGLVKKELGDFQGAIKDYTKSIKIHEIPATFSRIGDCWLSLNDTSKACEFWRKANIKGFTNQDTTKLNLCKELPITPK